MKTPGTFLPRVLGRAGIATAVALCAAAFATTLAFARPDLVSRLLEVPQGLAGQRIIPIVPTKPTKPKGGIVQDDNPAPQAAFASGNNIVIYRVGSGTGSLINTGNPVFLDEYTPDGTLVQSIALPTAVSGAQRQLIASGTATSEGLLTRSQDGRYLILTGYGATPPVSGLAGTSGATVPRVVGRVDALGNVDTSTALTDFATGNNPRSAASVDGTSFWVTGGAGGVRVANALGATTSTQLNSVLTNARQVNIFNGQLYVGASSGTNTFRGVSTVGTGTPTTTNQTITRLPGLTDTNCPSTYSYFLADLDNTVAGVDTLYVADDTSGAGGAITKFSLVSGSWTSNGTVGTTADAYRGLTGTVSGTTVTLYATRKGGSGATGGGELVRVTDASGYNGTFSATPALLATAGTNTAFRGVALAPVSYAVTYNGNGNTGGAPPTDSNRYAAGATVTVLDNTGGLVKTGFAFAGWNTAADGSGTSYQPSATFTINANTTLFAQWTAVDTTPPDISYTPFSNMSSTSNRTLSTAITDAGSGVPTSGAGLPRIYFRKGTSGSYVSNPCSFVSGSNYDCVIDHSLLGGVAVSDTVQYYVAAQDSASTPNVTTNPSTGASGFTANPPAASTPPTTPNSYSIADNTPPTITYTAFADATSTSNRTLSITVTDAGSGVPTGGTGLPVIYFRKGTSGVYSSNQCAFVSGSSYSCAIDYTLVSGGSVAVGDTIQYYIAAQDNAVPPNVTTNPLTGATSFTANPPAAMTPPTPNSYFVLSPIQITEYMYNGSGPNSVGEFVEFTNISGAAVDMTGWSFDDSSRAPGSQPLSAFGTVQPGESVIMTELTAAAFRTEWSLSPSIKVVGGNTNNLGRADEINLYNGSNQLMDRLTYDDQTIPGTVRTNTRSGWAPLGKLGPQTITADWVLSTANDAQNSRVSASGDTGNPGVYNIGAAGVLLTESGGSTNVAEGGATDSYTVVLRSQPAADVTVNINPDAQITTNPTTLTFTAANWNVPQAVTVTAVDDAAVEGIHTGTISHVVTSGDVSYNGVGVGTVIASITDNDFASQPPTIQEATANTYVSLPATSPGALSGVINDPTDPGAMLGIDFAIADPDTLLDGLNVTASSSNGAVVPNANLTLTGTGASRNLKVTPVGVGYADITVTVSDGSNTASYVVNYAASAASGTPASTYFYTGTSDGSASVAVDSNYMFVGDDENQVLRLYDRAHSGLPAYALDVTSALGFTDLSHPEADIEAATKVGSRIYWLTSHGNSKDGDIRVNRYRLFATDIGGSGASATLSYIGRYDGLRTDLINWDHTNAHGKGVDYYGLQASAASGVIPEAAGGSGFNIEGFVMAPGSATTGYVCFRAPISPASSRTKALVVPVTNLNLLVSGNPTAGPATFGAPVELDLGGRGIRDIARNASDQYVIVAGPPDGATGTPPSDFRLYTWTGNPGDAPVLRTTSLSGLNPEGVVEVPDSLTASSTIQLVSDGGDTVLYNDGVIAKDLAQSNFKKFRTDLVMLGSEVGPGTLQFSSATYSVAEGGGSVTITVSRAGGSTGAASVSYATADGTAAAPGDYTATSDTLNWADGDSADKTFSVFITDDNLYEGDETFGVSLNSPTGATLGAPSTATVTVMDNDVAPTVSVSDVTIAEPSSGTVNALFHVTLSAPSGLTATVNFSTADGTAAAPDDYESASGTITFLPGETSQTVSVAVKSDAIPEGPETFTLNLSSPSNATVADAQGIATITPSAVPGSVIISEFRLRGPGTASPTRPRKKLEAPTLSDGSGQSAALASSSEADEFVELYNATDSDIVVADSAPSGLPGEDGWALASSDAPLTPKYVIPGGTVIPARGHFLIANVGYSLSSYAAPDAPGGVPATYSADIPDGAGLALFRTARPTAASESAGDILDRVGFRAPGAAYVEGTGLTPEGGVNVPAEHSFMRKAGAGQPQDTGDNEADFDLISTDAGSYGGRQAMLGAPGPENSASPVERTAHFGLGLLDPSRGSSSPPNRERSFTSDPANNSTFGALAIRRRVVNNTGVPVTRLRFRVAVITGYPLQGADMADLRVRSSADVQVSGVGDAGTCSPDPAPCVVTVRGLTLEGQSAQPNGGGLNSTLSAGSVSLATPLAAGASVNVEFLLGIQRTGRFRFFVYVEALP